MTVGVGLGDDVAQVATPEREGTQPGWHARLLVAFGGAVLVVVAILLASSWSNGLRPSTFEQLRSDLKDGTVQQWYAAESLQKAPLDFKEALPSGMRGDLDESANGEVLPPRGDPLGGILVWRTWGHSGWQVAGQSGLEHVGDSYSETATDESTALVGQLRAASVPMKPYEFSDSTSLDALYGIGAMLLLGGLIIGSAPRVGTRWFWFWVIINVPLALGVVAYAVMELIGIRRRPDPPLNKRLTGIVGFVGAIVTGMVVSLVADWLRQRGLPLPF